MTMLLSSPLLGAGQRRGAETTFQSRCLTSSSRKGSRHLRHHVLTQAATDGGKRRPGPFEDGFWENMSNNLRPKEKTDFPPGKDVLWDLAVTFEESVLGADKPLTYQAKLFCEKCKGKGLVGNTTIQCSNCTGKGFFKGDRSATITVPAGVTNGSKLRVKEAGDFGNPNGALIVRVTAPYASATVRREGADLFSDVAVRFPDPAQDSSVKVKTIDGKEGELRVPAGTKVGAALRVKGKGAPTTPGGAERGDHYFVVKTIN